MKTKFFYPAEFSEVWSGISNHLIPRGRKFNSNEIIIIGLNIINTLLKFNPILFRKLKKRVSEQFPLWKKKLKTSRTDIVISFNKKEVKLFYQIAGLIVPSELLKTNKDALTVILLFLYEITKVDNKEIEKSLKL